MAKKVEEKEVTEKEPVEKEAPVKSAISQAKHLTDEEKASLQDGNEPPPGYMNSDIKEEDEKTPVQDKEKEPVKEEAKEPVEKEIKEEPKEEKKDWFEKLEREIDKPDGKEDLVDFTPREKAYFYRMRRDRKNRQQAEADRDQALFREKKLKEASEKQKEEIVDDPLAGKAPDDLMTVEEVKELMARQAKPAKKEEEPSQQTQTAPNPSHVRYLQMCEAEARQAHPDDFDATLELSADLVENDAEALTEVANRVRNGENPALVMYEVVQAHKDFQTLLPAAQVRVKARLDAKKNTPGKEPDKAPEPTPDQEAKEREAKAAEEALEKNAQKQKTTAHVSSLEGKPTGELTAEDIVSMSDVEFAKLPREKRQWYLKQFASAPANSR